MLSSVIVIFAEPLEQDPTAAETEGVVQETVALGPTSV